MFQLHQELGDEEGAKAPTKGERTLGVRLEEVELGVYLWTPGLVL